MGGEYPKGGRYSYGGGEGESPWGGKSYDNGMGK
jgi:hypothetical protein